VLVSLNDDEPSNNVINDLNMVYDKIVKNSKETLIIVEWIKLLYSILSYNPVIKKSDLKKLLDKE
jgi:hypothetical protein